MTNWLSRRSFSPERLRASRWLRQCAATPFAKYLASWLYAVVFVLALGGVSQATVDLTGDWYVSDVFPSSQVPIVQSGTSLKIGSVSGTIDPSTGSFQFGFLDCHTGWVCPCYAQAKASTDGNTFAGEIYTAGPWPNCHSPTCACMIQISLGPVYGSRSPCGDGVVDPGEACDDANFGRNGDCCVLGCTLAPAGRACTSDGNPCTSDLCDAAATCTHPAASAGTVCRPAVGACDVAESCDGVSSYCPADAKQPNGTDCSDDIFCNGRETTCRDGVCQTNPPCPLLCDEANDRCVTACPPAPRTCRAAARSSLLVKGDTARHELVWKWTKGAQTSQAEFGDPTGTTDYALCIFAGTASSLVDEAVIPAAASTWSILGTKGYAYKDPAAAVGGIDTIRLRGSIENTSKVRVHGRQAGLPILPLPLPAPVTVQLFNGDSGVCWGTSYTAMQLLRNDTGRLKAKTP